ncbi:hypothetical protein Rsub_10689 [Raphidocelis subcapitata]|uniref:Uncharacterized protein n=1 Tax=Raphidocelis subcapitata TaxID=307507 RepID=A0A2V0PF92_9CHLO|nr:hypothetical protein Rsub_10689 [Raphidocelis subcapitata]|eukprot:GBF98189.1 hypothetical protein Rsub_10689 [Raphidocelis subcapitata]
MAPPSHDDRVLKLIIVAVAAGAAVAASLRLRAPREGSEEPEHPPSPRLGSRRRASARAFVRRTVRAVTGGIARVTAAMTGCLRPRAAGDAAGGAAGEDLPPASTEQPAAPEAAAVPPSSLPQTLLLTWEGQVSNNTAMPPPRLLRFTMRGPGCCEARRDAYAQAAGLRRAAAIALRRLPSLRVAYYPSAPEPFYVPAPPAEVARMAWSSPPPLLLITWEGQASSTNTAVPAPRLLRFTMRGPGCCEARRDAYAQTAGLRRAAAIALRRLPSLLLAVNPSAPEPPTAPAPPAAEVALAAPASPLAAPLGWIAAPIALPLLLTWEGQVSSNNTTVPTRQLAGPSAAAVRLAINSWARATLHEPLQWRAAAVTLRRLPSLLLAVNPSAPEPPTAPAPPAEVALAAPASPPPPLAAPLGWVAAPIAPPLLLTWEGQVSSNNTAMATRQLAGPSAAAMRLAINSWARATLHEPLQWRAAAVTLRRLPSLLLAVNPSAPEPPTAPAPPAEVALAAPASPPPLAAPLGWVAAPIAPPRLLLTWDGPGVFNSDLAPSQRGPPEDPPLPFPQPPPAPGPAGGGLSFEWEGRGWDEDGAGSTPCPPHPAASAPPQLPGRRGGPETPPRSNDDGAPPAVPAGSAPTEDAAAAAPERPAGGRLLPRVRSSRGRLGRGSGKQKRDARAASAAAAVAAAVAGLLAPLPETGAGAAAPRADSSDESAAAVTEAALSPAPPQPPRAPAAAAAAAASAAVAGLLLSLPAGSAVAPAAAAAAGPEPFAFDGAAPQPAAGDDNPRPLDEWYERLLQSDGDDYGRDGGAGGRDGAPEADSEPRRRGKRRGRGAGGGGERAAPAPAFEADRGAWQSRQVPPPPPPPAVLGAAWPSGHPQPAPQCFPLPLPPPAFAFVPAYCLPQHQQQQPAGVYPFLAPPHAAPPMAPCGAQARAGGGLGLPGPQHHRSWACAQPGWGCGPQQQRRQQQQQEWGDFTH